MTKEINYILAEISERLDPDDIVDILNLSTDEVVQLLYGEIVCNIDRFRFLVTDPTGDTDHSSIAGLTIMDKGVED